ncbi:MAG: hypothetical protein ABIK92_12545 [Pseudomonadota bacterium]
MVKVCPTCNNVITRPSYSDDTNVYFVCPHCSCKVMALKEFMLSNEIIEMEHYAGHA